MHTFNLTGAAQRTRINRTHTTIRYQLGDPTLRVVIVTSNKDIERLASYLSSNERAWVKTLIALRKRTPSLRRGDYLRLLAKDGHYAFARTLGEDKVLVVMNATSRARQIEVPCAALGWGEGRLVQSLINGEKYIVNGGKLSLNLSPWSGVWIG